MFYPYFSLVLLLASTFTLAEQSPQQSRSIASQYGQPLAAQSAKTEQAPAPIRQKEGIKFTQRLPLTAELNQRFWIYDASVVLHGDADLDGYYHHIDLEFDADTIFNHALVYARLYLGRDDSFEEYHTTSVFAIEGESSNDSLIVESEFISGYAADEYELLLELYDANTDQLLAFSDGIADPDLMFLAVESEEYDQPVLVIVEEGGSTGYVSLLALMALIALRRFTRPGTAES